MDSTANSSPGSSPNSSPTCSSNSSIYSSPKSSSISPSDPSSVSSSASPPPSSDWFWHHRPIHVFVPDAAYIVTAGTLYKELFFRDKESLGYLQDRLFQLAAHYGWKLQAWAVFANHYHWIGISPEDAESLKKFIRHLHTDTARWLNAKEGKAKRKVWFQYWDTCLTFEKSYYARLNYVLKNAVHHGMAAEAEQYAFCSAKWFAEQADGKFRRKVESFKFDEIEIVDDF